MTEATVITLATQNHSSTGSHNEKTPAFTRLIKSALLLVSVTGLLSVQGCFHDDDDDPVIPSEDASGLYTGTGSVNSGTTLADVRGFVHDGRFIFFDAAEAVLYDGQLSSTANGNVAASINVYKDGAKVTPTAVNATGTVSNRSSMSLVLNGTGYAAGTLTLTFDSLYDRGATIAKLAADSSARWIGDAHTPDTTVTGITRFISSTDVNDNTITGDTSSPTNCVYDGIKSIPDASINIYLLTSLDVTDVGFGSCDHDGTGTFTGFFAVVDGVAADDTLLFAMTNGTHSNFSIMTK